MTCVKKRKNEQRRAALARRRSLTNQERIEKSRAICRHLMSIPEITEVETVFSYRAVWDEADPGLVNTWLEKEGKRVAYPISLPGGRMKAAIPGGDDAWEEGAFGIFQPIETKSRILWPQDFDVVLVPCLAFDREGRRMGHGGGYYDRFLPHCRKDALRVLIAFEVQKMDRIVTEETDAPVDLLVTEAGIYPGITEKKIWKISKEQTAENTG